LKVHLYCEPSIFKTICNSSFWSTTIKCMNTLPLPQKVPSYNEISSSKHWLKHWISYQIGVCPASARTSTTVSTPLGKHV
jgi:hypothetical protein